MLMSKRQVVEVWGRGTGHVWRGGPRGSCCCWALFGQTGQWMYHQDFTTTCCCCYRWRHWSHPSQPFAFSVSLWLIGAASSKNLVAVRNRNRLPFILVTVQRNHILFLPSTRFLLLAVGIDPRPIKTSVGLGKCVQCDASSITPWSVMLHRATSIEPVTSHYGYTVMTGPVKT